MDYGNYLTRLMENCRRIVQSSYHQPSSSTMPSTLSTAHLFQEPQVIAPLPAAPRPVAPKDMLPTDISSRPYAFNSLAPPAATTTEPCASSINLSPTATSLDSMTEKARESERRDEIAVPEKPVGSRPFRACSHCRLAKRRCYHNPEDLRALEQFIEPARLSEDQDYIIKDPAGIRVRIPRTAAEGIEQVTEPRVMRSSVPKVLTSQNEAKPTNVSESKTPTCQNESRPLNERFIEPTRLSEDQEHIIKASGGVLARNSRPAAEEIEKCIRPSVIKSLVLARQNEAKPQSVSDSKTPTCPKESRPLNVMPLGRNRRPACVNCRKAKRRCTHHSDGEEDPERAMEPAIPRPHARKAYIKDRTESAPMKTMAMQEVASKHTSRLHSSVPRESASQIDHKPTLAAENVAETRVRRSRASHSKESNPRNELGRPVRTRHMRKDVKKKDLTVSSRRPPLLYGLKDDIALLRICVKLKDVIDWGKIGSFWMMVADTLELETGKSCSNKQVSRHVKILADNRRAEQREIEQKGKISKPRVSAECRPLLDRWNAGGNQNDTVSTRLSTMSSSVEDEDDISLGEQRGQGLEIDTAPLEAQKRSATNAWLDTSYEETSSKRLKLGSPELISGTSKSSTESFGCWSVSGSSVTSESSIGDESEDEDKGNVNVDEGGWFSASVGNGIS